MVELKVGDLIKYSPDYTTATAILLIVRINDVGLSHFCKIVDIDSELKDLWFGHNGHSYTSSIRLDLLNLEYRCEFLGNYEESMRLLYG